MRYYLFLLGLLALNACTGKAASIAITEKFSHKQALNQTALTTTGVHQMSEKRLHQISSPSPYSISGKTALILPTPASELEKKIQLHSPACLEQSLALNIHQTYQQVSIIAASSRFLDLKIYQTPPSMQEKQKQSFKYVTTITIKDLKIESLVTDNQYQAKASATFQITLSDNQKMQTPYETKEHAYIVVDGQTPSCILEKTTIALAVDALFQNSFEKKIMPFYHSFLGRDIDRISFDKTTKAAPKRTAYFPHIAD